MAKAVILCLHIICFSLGNLPKCKAAECINPFYNVGEKCLHFANLDFLEVNQSDAVNYCKDIGGNLVMIQTPTQFGDIITYIKENEYPYAYWIDGSDSEEEGRWVFHNKELVPMGTPFWYVYGNDEGFWQEPRGGSTENCLVMHSEPWWYWNDMACNKSSRPLCEANSENSDYFFFQSEIYNIPDSTLDCPVPYVPVGDKCFAFLFYTATMTWAEAVLACEAMSGTLATIGDPELLRAVYLYLHEHSISQESFWIGGSDIMEEGSWVWLDGSAVARGPPIWGFFKSQEQPFNNASNNCLGLLSDGYHYLRDDDCEDSATYKPICMTHGDYKKINDK